MTLDEKIALLHGTRDPEDLGQAGYWPGLPRLRIPPLRFADGPPGVNVNRDSTAMPAPVLLAATFSEQAARLYGGVLGREARALRQDVLLAPHANIVRDPLFRRNHTTLSEDPLLTSRLAVAEILGIQAEGVMAQVKHLAGYNGSENVEIDDRTLRELYLPAFAAAVKAGVASVMCAYNRINSDWACENAGIQNEILRREWDFGGFVTSDWGAIHGPLAITKGTDLEMPGRSLAGRGGPWFSDELKAAVQDGSVPVAALDQALLRILGQMERFGLLDRKHTPKSIDVEKHAGIVRHIAEQGAVLLKNEDALPLQPADLSSLALIGPTAGQLAAGFLGERGYGFEHRLISPLDALRRSVPDVSYSIGVDLTGEALVFSDGKFTVTEPGTYTFMVQPKIGNGAEGGGSIAIDGTPVARTGGPGFGGTGVVPKKWSSLLPTTDGRDNGRGSIELTPGNHRISVDIHSTGESPLDVRIAWITPSMRRAAIDRAVGVAKAVRTPVVFAWSGSGTFMLPEDQDELIASVANANPRTIVVLNTGGPVAMPWKDKVRAILEMWYPGQEGGWATANLLLGRASPAGKLPVTFPARLEDAPARDSRHPERSPRIAPPGVAGTRADAPVVKFTEGTLVGYRWYDAQNIEPLFPFGHGLSYTTFEYSDLSVKGSAVEFTLRNTGNRIGFEVPQVYVGSPRSLAAFEPVELRPGQSRRVRMRVERRAGSLVAVGASVGDIRLTTPSSF